MELVRRLFWKTEKGCAFFSEYNYYHGLKSNRGLLSLMRRTDVLRVDDPFEEIP